MYKYTWVYKHYRTVETFFFIRDLAYHRVLRGGTSDTVCVDSVSKRETSSLEIIER